MSFLALGGAGVPIKVVRLRANCAFSWQCLIKRTIQTLNKTMSFDYDECDLGMPIVRSPSRISPETKALYHLYLPRHYLLFMPVGVDVETLLFAFVTKKEVFTQRSEL